jgi:hypothetical protein
LVSGTWPWKIGVGLGISVRNDNAKNSFVLMITNHRYAKNRFVSHLPLCSLVLVWFIPSCALLCMVAQNSKAYIDSFLFSLHFVLFRYSINIKNNTWCLFMVYAKWNVIHKSCIMYDICNDTNMTNHYRFMGKVRFNLLNLI